MKPRKSQHIGNFLDLNFFTLPSGHNNYYYDIMFLLFIPLSLEVGGAKHQYSFHALHTSCMNQNSRMHTKQFQNVHCLTVTSLQWTFQLSRQTVCKFTNWPPLQNSNSIPITRMTPRQGPFNQWLMIGVHKTPFFVVKSEHQKTWAYTKFIIYFIYSEEASNQKSSITSARVLTTENIAAHKIISSPYCAVSAPWCL